MGLSDREWFTEIFQNEGTAFSLRIKSKLHSEKSEYQQIDVYDTETFGKLMVIDGCVMLSDRDNFLYHEMMVHPALFTHSSPKDVLIIGGGDCGTLKEVLKHDTVKNVTQVDIDERVTRISEQYFPSLCQSNNDPRASLQFDDGILWVKQSKESSLDVIIIDSTDPVGPAEGLFAIDFYKDCFRALKPGGLVVQQSESPLLHSQTIINKIHQDFGEAGFSNIHTMPFPQPVYPTGWWSATMVSKEQDLFSFREQDAMNKAFTTQYYNAGIHKAALSTPEFMKGLI